MSDEPNKIHYLRQLNTSETNKQNVFISLVFSCLVGFLTLNTHPRWKLYFTRFYADYQEHAPYLTIFIQTNRTIWGGVGRLQAKLDKQMVLIIWEFPKSIHDILRHIPSIHHHHLGYMGTFWEQQAHWLFTLLLKISGLFVLLSILIRCFLNFQKFDNPLYSKAPASPGGLNKDN